MKKIEEQLKRQFERVRLTQAEKNSMRLAIEEHMRRNPLAPATSPWQEWMFNVRLAAPIVAAALLCSGTAYAAQGALPGDLLYPVKIHVNEPVEVALAATPEAKAQVEAQIAQTRVEEAQALAAQGTLTATTTQELQNSFNAYATDAIAQANQAQLTATTTGAASTTASVLKVSLNVQAHILNALGVQVGLHNGTHATSTPERPQTRDYEQHEKRTPNGDASTTITETASSMAGPPSSPSSVLGGSTQSNSPGSSSGSGGSVMPPTVPVPTPPVSLPKL